MPNYFLHLREKDILIRDIEGAALRDLDAARAEARQAIREIAAEHLLSGKELRLTAIEICDDHGNQLATVSLAASLAAIIPVLRAGAETELSRSGHLDLH